MRKRTILLVDDDDVAIFLFRKALIDKPEYHLVVTGSGEHAFHYLLECLIKDEMPAYIFTELDITKNDLRPFLDSLLQAEKKMHDSSVYFLAYSESFFSRYPLIEAKPFFRGSLVKPVTATILQECGIL